MAQSIAIEDGMSAVESARESMENGSLYNVLLSTALACVEQGKAIALQHDQIWPREFDRLTTDIEELLSEIADEWQGD